MGAPESIRANANLKRAFSDRGHLDWLCRCHELTAKARIADRSSGAGRRARAAGAHLDIAPGWGYVMNAMNTENLERPHGNDITPAVLIRRLARRFGAQKHHRRRGQSPGFPMTGGLRESSTGRSALVNNWK